MWEGRSRASQAVHYLGYPGLSEQKPFLSGENLIPYLIVLLVVVSFAGTGFIHDGCLVKWMPWPSKA